jgi:hypothetical protein
MHNNGMLEERLRAAAALLHYAECDCFCVDIFAKAGAIRLFFGGHFL